LVGPPRHDAAPDLAVVDAQHVGRPDGVPTGRP
jgi:hypothetical protein